jgi:ABC-type phosphate transport system substrate-binding protein
MKTRLFILFVALAACAFPQQGFSVVVHKDNPVKSISKVQLRKMMLGETPAWPGGAKVLVLMGPAGDGARGAALQQICGMGESDFSKHALQVSFDGGSKAMPKTLPSTASVRTVVALTPGGLGIVEGAEAGPGLRLLVIE